MSCAIWGLRSSRGLPKTGRPKAERSRGRRASASVCWVSKPTRAYRAVYPAVGAAIDRLVTAGARVILGVSGAMAPRADALIDRAVTGDAQKRLAQLAEGLTRKAWLEASQSDQVVRPYSDQERAAAEKELPLSGSAPVASVVAYAERPSGPGLHLMTVSQNPVEAMTGLVAGGANIILVAASRGLFAGSIASPSVVVAPAASGDERGGTSLSTTGWKARIPLWKQSASCGGSWMWRPASFGSLSGRGSVSSPSRSFGRRFDAALQEKGSCR